MNKNFQQYIKALGIVGPIKKKIQEIYDFYKNECSYDINDIFISDYIKDDGSRELESLWFFSEKYIMEAKQFITTDTFDNATFKGKIIRWEIIKKDYDFIKATKDSRMNLRIEMTGVGAIFKASKENCDALKKIFLKYILPNLIE